MLCLTTKWKTLLHFLCMSAEDLKYIIKKAKQANEDDENFYIPLL